MGRVEDVGAELAVRLEQSSAPASTGNAMSTSRLVTRVFQTKIGIRNIVMPARACR